MKSDKNKFTVAINGRFLTQPATGVQRYAYEIMRAWDTMLDRGEIDPAQYQIEIIAPRLNKPFNEFNHISIRQVGFMRGNLWEQIELPLHTRGKFLFNPCNIGPIIKMNQAVTIHDASVYAVPWSYSNLFRLKYRLVYSILTKTAKLVFTVTEFSKNELQKYLHIPESKLLVTSEGCDHMERIVPDPSIFQRKHLGEKPYVLAVGSNAPHKNLSILGEVAKILDADIDIVIAGEEQMPWFTKSSTDVETGKIKRLGYVTDEELKALYQNAVAFIFPSQYEGFGLPPLEAMVCGCPVICAKIPVLEELCGDAAMYIEGDLPGELSDKIYTILGDDSFKEKLIKKGTISIKKFIWDIVADSLWKKLKKIIIF